MIESTDIHANHFTSHCMIHMYYDDGSLYKDTNLG